MAKQDAVVRNAITEDDGRVAVRMDRVVHDRLSDTGCQLRMRDGGLWVAIQRWRPQGDVPGHAKHAPCSYAELLRPFDLYVWEHFTGWAPRGPSGDKRVIQHKNHDQLDVRFKNLDINAGVERVKGQRKKTVPVEARKLWPVSLAEQVEGLSRRLAKLYVDVVEATEDMYNYLPVREKTKLKCDEAEAVFVRLLAYYGFDFDVFAEAVGERADLLRTFLARPAVAVWEERWRHYRVLPDAAGRETNREFAA